MSESSSYFNVVESLFGSSVMDDVEAESKLISQEVGMDDLETCISSGSLATDLILGGGYKSGRVYSFVGPEHGGKTSFVKQAIGQALKAIPYSTKAIYIDAEGTLDPTWAGHIWEHDPDKLYEVLGRKDNTGAWVNIPQVRYFKPQFGERALRYVIKLCNSRPDKVKIKNQWWYQYTPLPSDDAKKTGGYTVTQIKEFLTKEIDGKSTKLWDAEMYKETGTFCIPVPNNYAGPELIIGIDSWTALTPGQIALDDSNALGAQARMFAKYVNNIKSLIASKGIVLIGTKQIRQKIGGFGDSEYCSGGEALKHIDDVRCRIGTVSNKIRTGKSDYNIHVEDEDEYRYFTIRNKKNKVFVPYKNCEGRWWTGHKGSSGFGVDPVFDTLQYLKMTGQYEQGKRDFRIHLLDECKVANTLYEIPFSYDSFKKSILDGCIYDKNLEKVNSKFNLRSYLQSQIKSGSGLQYFLLGGNEEQPENENEVVEEE